MLQAEIETVYLYGVMSIPRFIVKMDFLPRTEVEGDKFQKMHNRKLMVIVPDQAGDGETVKMVIESVHESEVAAAEREFS